MNNALSICFALLLFYGWSGEYSHALNDDPPIPRGAQSTLKIFLIGNSLTWDTLPSLLDGDVQWHVDCGKSLKQIYDQPGKPCVQSSLPWTTALKEKQYDFLCVQPFSGTNLATDISVISQWMELQPRAIVVLHTGWSRAADFEKSYHAALDERQTMVHSRDYFEKLTAELRTRYPHREIRSTRAIEVLDAIWHDVKRSSSPFSKFEELYRDDIHMTTQAGRYLMHNAMRQTLGQVASTQGFQIDAREREYLDGKLKALLAAYTD